MCKRLDNDTQNKIKLLTTILIFIAIIFTNASGHKNISSTISMIYCAISIILAGAALFLTFKYNLNSKVFAGLIFLFWLGYSFYNLVNVIC